MAQLTLQEGIIQTANALGISPEDLATIISYETGGTFNPTQAGPTTKWGQHRGLIQFGEPQAKQYGVDWNDPIGSQLGPNGAVYKYLKQAGVQPGMGLKDVYSAVNAGQVGLYNASDEAAGGAPGTVSDKVNFQMEGHKAKAQSLIGSAASAPSAGGTSMGGYMEGPAAVAARSPGGLLDPSAPPDVIPSQQPATLETYADKLGKAGTAFTKMTDALEPPPEEPFQWLQPRVMGGGGQWKPFQLASQKGLLG